MRHSIQLALVFSLAIALAACSRKTTPKEASTQPGPASAPAQPQSPQPPPNPHGHSGEITALSFSRDGRLLVSCSLDNTIRIWDVESGRERQKLLPTEGVINTVAISPDGRRLAYGARDGTVSMRDLRSGAQLYKLGLSGGEVTGLAFTADGQYLVASGTKPQGDATLGIFRAANGDGVRQITVEWDDAMPLIVTPDGRLISSGTVSDEPSKLGLFVWDLRSGRVRHQYPILADAISPDGRWAAWVDYKSGPKINLFDLESGKLARTLAPPFPLVLRLDFTRDGRRILATQRDASTIVLWDTGTGAEVQKLTGDQSKLTTVAFSADGKRVAAAGYDGYNIKVWDVGSAKLVETFPREAAETAAGLNGSSKPASRP